jgi:hypothetical protein
MGLRQRLNEDRRVSAGIAAVVVVVAVASIVIQVLAGRRRFPSRLPDAFFSADDGRTFFAAGSDNVPPFDYKGRPAVRAYVYECDGKRFVGYLERYTPEAHQVMLDERQRLARLEPGKSSPPNGAVIGADISGRELKKPGESGWVKSSDHAGAARVTDVRCPDGAGTPVPVAP